MKKYNNIYAEVFDSKNTMITQTIDFIKTKKDLMSWAVRFSLTPKVYKVIVYNGDSWNEYQKGELISWSYPMGV